MKTAFRKRLVFPRHNPRQSSCVALHRTQPFATAFANGEKESTTLASEPRVSDVLAILKPQWKLFQSPAATQPVDCKKTILQSNQYQPGSTYSGLTPLLNRSFEAVVVRPGCNPTLWVPRGWSWWKPHSHDSLWG